MDPTVFAALIALIGTTCLAAVTLIGALITLFIGMRGLKVEREKLATETARVRTELDETRQQRLAIEAANIEIEKQRSMNLLENRKNIYAEMLELVYRLKNQLRDLVEHSGRGRFGQELYLLTENLYKYRAYIDEDTFQMLHRYKRALQDVQVLINRMTRSPEIEDGDPPLDWEKKQEIRTEYARKAYQDAKTEIETTYQEIEKSYIEITRRVQSHIDSVLIRKDEKQG